MAYKGRKPLHKDPKDHPQKADGSSSGSNDNQDTPPSVRQIDVAIWLANYKSVELPPTVTTSYRHWWKWINEVLTRVDFEDAHAADIDFPRLTINLDDPVSVIGALKYRDKVNTPSPEEEAVQMLLNGIHPYTVEDNLMLTSDQLAAAVRKVELISDYEIEWGSV